MQTVDQFCLQINSLNIMPSLPSYKENAVEGGLGGLTAALGC